MLPERGRVKLTKALLMQCKQKYIRKQLTCVQHRFPPDTNVKNPNNFNERAQHSKELNICICSITFKGCKWTSSNGQKYIFN
jgi:hypothetical protein